MEKNEKNKKLICSICEKKVLKKPSISGKPYAVRLIDPIICDICSQVLANKDDENQSKLEAKSHAILINKSSKQKPNVEKATAEIVNPIEDIKLNDLIATVKAVIKGQDDHVETITTAIFKNHMIASPELKSNLIILGDSGSGKTEIIKILANEFKLPYIIADATRYTEAGYTGANVDEMIKDLCMRAGDNILKAEKGILVIDEGDKKGSVGGNGRDVSGENVLFSLLKILEGTLVPVTNGYGDTVGLFDTSKLTVIFIGAFPNLVEIREKRLKHKGIVGFVKQETVITNMSPEYIADDFIAGGFPKEFIGRFDLVVELDKLTLKDYEEIIRDSKKSIFFSYIKALEEKGVEIVYIDDIISEIAIRSKKLNIGARGIKNVVQNMFKNIMSKVLKDDKKYTKCNISKKTVHDSTDFILI